MTGAEHYAEASNIVLDGRCDYGCPHAGCPHEMAYLARAQVHATLALATAVLDAAPLMPPAARRDWDHATGRLPELTPGGFDGPVDIGDGDLEAAP